MNRAEWTNTLPNVGTGGITLGVKRDLGVISDSAGGYYSFPISDNPNGAGSKIEGVETYKTTWYDRYIWRRINEFCRAIQAHKYGSAEYTMLMAYIQHLYDVKGTIKRRKWERGEKTVWHSFEDGKEYPSRKAWEAEKERREKEEQRKAIPAIFAQVLETNRQYYNNTVYRQLYSPEEREALALKKAGEVTAKLIAETE